MKGRVRQNLKVRQKQLFTVRVKLGIIAENLSIPRVGRGLGSWISPHGYTTGRIAMPLSSDSARLFPSVARPEESADSSPFGYLCVLGHPAEFQTNVSRGTSP